MGILQKRIIHALLLGCCVGAPAQGAIIAWDSPAGGSLSVPALWNGGIIPTLTDTALFNLGGSYPIITGSTLFMDQMLIGTDTIFANFGTNGLGLVRNASLVNPSIAMGLASGDVVSFTLNGGILDGEIASLGAVAGSQVTVDVNSPSATLFVNTDIAIGYAGTGVLNLSNSGFGDLGETSLGHLPSGNGTVTADGVGTLWGNAFSLRTGYGGTGHFTITNGAVATSPRIDFGFEATGDGTGVVNGLGSSLVSGSWLRVGTLGTGMLTLENGGRAEAVVGDVGFGVGSNGTLVVTDTNSLLLTQGRFDVGVIGTGTLEIRNQANVDVMEMTIGALGGNGTVLVEDLAILQSTQAIDVGTDQFSTGSITLDNGFLFVPGLSIGSTGTLIGNGAITGNLTSLGVLSPGLPIGTLTVSGSMTLPGGLVAGSLRISVDASGSDQITAQQASSIGGILVLELADGFVPTAGTTYTVVQCLAGLTGIFDAFVKPPLTPGIDFDVEYTATSVLIHVLSAGPIGDLNGDGLVNGSDLLIILGAWGTADPIADLNNDGVVSGIDLITLLGSWTG